jgi:hypothetical protein
VTVTVIVSMKMVSMIIVLITHDGVPDDVIDDVNDDVSGDRDRDRIDEDDFDDYCIDHA